MAGIFAGLEIGAKQNVAVLAAVALGVPLLARCEWRALARAAAGFTAAAAAVSAGVWISGGWAKFVEYGFTAKGKFLATGLPLSATVAQFLDGMRKRSFMDLPAAAALFVPCAGFRDRLPRPGGGRMVGARAGGAWK